MTAASIKTNLYSIECGLLFSGLVLLIFLEGTHLVPPVYNFSTGRSGEWGWVSSGVVSIILGSYRGHLGWDYRT